MKKIILLFCLIPFISISQNKADKYVLKAKPFLNDDVCNNTGIDWVKAALNVDPQNKEAINLLKKCNDLKFNNAVELLEKDLKDSNSANELMRLVKIDEYNTESVNYLLAQHLVDRGNYSKAKDYLNKIIDINSTNIDYRWLRVRCNSLSNNKEDQFIATINDLNFMIENGGASAKVYAHLGTIEELFGEYIFTRKKAPVNNGHSDNNSEYVKLQTEINNEAINHYKNAIKGYKKAIEMNFKDKDLSFKERDLLKNITEVENSTKNL